MRAREWCLFIDESGDFATERSIAAGVLLEEPDTPGLDRALRELLGSALPFVAWPIHAAHLNVSTFAPAAWVATGRRSSSWEATLSTASGVLEKLDSEAWAAAVADAARPKDLRPHLSLARKLSSADRPLARTLDGLRATLRAELGDAIRRFAAAYERGCFVVGASTEPAADGGAAEDAYLRSLAALLERVLALLRGSGAHKVWVLPAIRDVRGVTGLPAFALRAQDVGSRVAEAERFALGAPAAGERDAKVRLVAGMPRTYDESVHGGIVLADFVANALRVPASQARHWSDLTRAGAVSFGLSLEHVAGLLADAGPLPAVAADGAARQAIQAVMQDPQASPPLPASPGWAREQAARWIAARRRLPGVAA